MVHLGFWDGGEDILNISVKTNKYWKFLKTLK